MHAKGLTAIMTSMCLFICLTQQNRVWRERKRKEVWGVIVLVFENLLFLPADAKNSEFRVNFKFTFNKKHKQKTPHPKTTRISTRQSCTHSKNPPVFFQKPPHGKTNWECPTNSGGPGACKSGHPKSPGNSPENPPELRRLSAEAGRLGRLLPLEGREMSCRRAWCKRLEV